MNKNITISAKPVHGLKLVAITKDQINNPLIVKIPNHITLISEEKTYYLYLGEKNTWNRNAITNYFNKINNCLIDQNLDIDVKSFTNNSISEEEVLQTIYEALLFANTELYTLKTKKKDQTEIIFNLLTSANLPEYTSEEQIVTQAQYIGIARTLQDMPPNKLYPEIFANQIVEEAKKIKNLKVTILDKKQIEALNMGLLLAVNAGSHYEPRLVVLEYTGDSKNQADILGLVGKGITFDSGGYSLKPSVNMKGMKFDMSGASIVCNSALAAAKLGLKLNFVAVACLTENRIGGHATLVETVAQSMNGLTVEINNTDAEGRLVLADGITYALRKGKATKIIELSTLTGAILIALGDYMTGAFSNNDILYNDFLKASQQANEEIWRMPIHEQNVTRMKVSPIADLSNIAKDGYGGSSNAAAFLQEFVEEKPFLHLDIAGTAYANGRGKAVLLKTLVQYMKNYNK